MWFLAVLDRGLSCVVDLHPQPSRPTILLYSDAEGTGQIGAVAQFPDGEILCLRGRIPRRVRRLLARRKTNIAAYELLAALVGLTRVL